LEALTIFFMSINIFILRGNPRFGISSTRNK
jgi:hypothetical protein